MVGRRKRNIFSGEMSQSSIYLGFDFSTQQIKCVAIDEELNFVCESAVRFDTDLPEFKTNGGVHIHDDNVTVTAPTALWVKALDLLLFRMQNGLFDFTYVKGISGCGQQHGSVFWAKGAKKALNKLKPVASLHDQLKDQFSIPDSPVWMDASTDAQCKRLEDSVGGPMKLAEITGSRAFVRMTGNQIMKISQTQPEAYANTERISLVSSFVPSILIGDYSPIDLSDGSGMNLLDVNTKTWSQKCLDACGENLGDKLGQPVPSHTVVGNICSYFCDKYGFPDHCKVVAFTGDNPSSLAGLCPRVGDVIMTMGTGDAMILWLTEWKPVLVGNAYINPVHSDQYYCLVGWPPPQAALIHRTMWENVIKINFLNTEPLVLFTIDKNKLSEDTYNCIKVSLGTSDTVFLWLQEEKAESEGHIFVNPINSHDYMAMVCFKNGSLERESIKDKCAGTWEKFEEMFNSTPMGNRGNFGLYFDQVEVQPFIQGTFRFNEKNEKVDSFPPEVEVRAILEGQMVARRVYSEMRGMKITPETRLIATGGASHNQAILQVLADVFNASVYTTDITDSAALGGCYRAIHAITGKSFEEAVKNHPEPVCVAKPTAGCVEVYDKMCERYRMIEKLITNSS